MTIPEAHSLGPCLSVMTLTIQNKESIFNITIQKGEKNASLPQIKKLTSSPSSIFKYGLRKIMPTS